MLRMVSYSHRPKSGQITCYLNRTYHLLTTVNCSTLDILNTLGARCRPIGQALTQLFLWSVHKSTALAWPIRWRQSCVKEFSMASCVLALRYRKCRWLNLSECPATPCGK